MPEDDNETVSNEGTIEAPIAATATEGAATPQTPTPVPNAISTGAVNPVTAVQPGAAQKAVSDYVGTAHADLDAWMEKHLNGTVISADTNVLNAVRNLIWQIKSVLHGVTPTS